MQTSFLKSLDQVLYKRACAFSAALPPGNGTVSDQTLILRPGGLGDLICADIALQELGLDAQKFSWLIEKRSRPWADFRGLTHWCYDGNPLSTLGQVRHRFPLVINTEQLYGLAQSYALLARTKDGRIVSFAANRGAGWSAATVPYDWRDQHETVEFARLFAAALGRQVKSTQWIPRARLEPPTTPPLVLIAGRQSESRRLDLDVWASLISSWRKNRSFVIAAAPEDAAFAADLIKRFDGSASLFAGSFDDLCRAIARSEEMFTMDGGGVHIASYFGVPMLALFTSGRDRKWHPLGEGSRILSRRDLPCQPCTKFGQVPPCPNNFACLQLENLKPEIIW